MALISRKILILAAVHLLFVLVKSEKTQIQGRDFQGNYILEDERRQDYQPYAYPPSYQHLNTDCTGYEKNQVLPFLGKGMQFFLLKLGVLGLIKAIGSLLFVGFLAKLPLVLIKLAFLKSFFLPFIAAPLFTYFFANNMDQHGESTMHDHPAPTTPTEHSPMDAMSGADMGRQLTDNLTSIAWQSVRMFAESDQCIERISCLIGATNKDSTMENIFSRMLKFLHYKSPSHVQDKLESIRNAFHKGSRTLTCSEDDYICNSPELVIQHGTRRVKVL